ncbi:MAG: branched-chain amino acid ABC transporter substrate-binding protein [Chloroflexia bacterium]
MNMRAAERNLVRAAVPVVIAAIIGVVLLVLLAPPSFGNAGDPQVVRIYASVPLHSFASIVHGAQMAIDETGGRIGNFKLDFVPLTDDKLRPDRTYHWDTDVELANARRAAADTDAVAYIGTYNSGAAKISIPVLNRVHLAMISPGNTYPGLTKPGTGTAGEPWIYYPLGEQNYFRVVPADDLQGNAAAAFAAQQLQPKPKSAYVLDDTELYGHGIAVIFAQAAKDLGITTVTGPESIDVHATDYTGLVQKIMAQNPDVVYFGGVTDNHPALVLKALRAAGYKGVFMGADGIGGGDFIQQAGDNAGPAYATLVGLPAAKLTGPGADWYSEYKSRWPSDGNEDFAPFGYEAAETAIHAIAQANTKDREAIRQAVAATHASDLPGKHILGDWQFDAHGDTSLVTISVQQMGATWDYQGVMSYNAQTKAWAFQGK